MSRLLVILVCTVAAVSLTPAAPVPVHLVPKDPPFTFPTRVGTKWVYACGSDERTVVISAVKEEKDGSKLVTTERLDAQGKPTPGAGAVTRISGTGVFVVKEDGGEYDRPWCLLKLPHRAGTSWETKAAFDRFESLGTTSAEPMERVTVPAGEFQAVRIIREETTRLVAVDGQIVTSWSDRTLYWFVDGIGLVKKGSHLELKSFAPGKD